MTGAHRRRDLAQHGLGPLDLVEVEERADEHAVRSADQDAERAADDAEQQPEHPSARRSGVLGRADAVLHDDLAFVVADGDGGGLDLDPALAVELLQRGQRLVGVVVGVERHGDHVVRARRVGPVV